MDAAKQSLKLPVADKKTDEHLYFSANFIKFVFILGVVAWHSDVCFNAAGPVAPVGSAIADFICSNLANAVIPGYFFISGLLFFNNVKRFSLRWYFGKLKRRVFTLLIPYLIWNCVGLGIEIYHYYSAGSGLPGVIVDGELSPLALLKGFWDYANGMPYAFAFWFIRNLIVIVILSPLAYLIGAKSRLVCLAFTVVCCLFDNSLGGFLFFTLGCTAAVFYKQALCRIKRGPAVIAFVVFAVCTVLSALNVVENYRGALFTVELLCAIIILFRLIRVYRKRLENRLIRYLTASTFFIYALHQFIVPTVRNTFTTLFGLTETLGVLAAVSCTFLTLVAFSLVIFTVMRFFVPRIAAVLCGNRL